MAAKTATVQTRQAELDRFASRRGWARGRFGSWRFHGFTVSVAAQGDRSKAYVAARGDDREFFGSLDELERHVAYLAVTGRRPGS